MDSSAKSICFMVDNLPPNSSWCVMGVGKDKFPVVAMGVVMGDTSVWVWKTTYISRGKLAKSNAELVAKTVRIAKELGREIASIEEARDMLDLRTG